MKKRWLLLPVFISTFFFAVPGGCDSSLPMNDGEVWLAIPAAFSRPVPGLWGASPLARGQVVSVSLTPLQRKKTPLSPQLLRRFQSRYPTIRFLNAENGNPKVGSFLMFGKVQWKNHFSALCRVSYSVQPANQKQGQATNYSASLHLSRAPVKGNNRWRVTLADDQSMGMG